LTIFGWVVLACLAGAWVWVAINYWATPILKVSTIGAAGAALLAGWVFGKWVVRVARYRDTLMKTGIGVGLALLGPILVRIHLWIFDRLFLWHGKLDKVLKAEGSKHAG
jgi:hypothetical protein